MGTAPWKGQILQSGFKTMIGGKEVELDTAIPPSQIPKARGMDLPVQDIEDAPESPAKAAPTAPVNQKFIAPANFYGSPKPKTKQALYVPQSFPSTGASLISIRSHDPNAPDSVVMKRPTKEHIKRYNKRYVNILVQSWSVIIFLLSRNLPVVDVVLDPILARKMRPHQKEGGRHYGLHAYILLKQQKA